MPSSKRDRIKRKHDAAINSLERCQGHLADLYNMFLEFHPTYSEGYLAISRLVQHEIDLVKQMKGFV